MSWVWLSVILWSTRLSFASVLQLSTRFMSWSTMTALSICFHHFTDSAALLRNCINCISAPFWIIDCACLTVEKCREQLCLTWLYIPCVYERLADSLIHMYRVKVSFCLSCLSIYPVFCPSIYGFNGLSVYVLVDHPSGLTRRDSYISRLIHCHAYERACPHDY